ncbi:MAG: hypothetical protein U9P14_08670 [Gemmatimonadota bacterium]|nr:hypothetical protein [Gemmatimonadota bacterium]
MYPEVACWLKGFLKARHKRAEIKVFETPRKKLSSLISDIGFQDRMPHEWVSWDIYVDIVGFVLMKKEAHLAFVECKLRLIKLRDLSQLIGYSLVAKPRYSFLVSPQGPSDSLRTLLKTYSRLDVLRYYYPPGKFPLSVVVAKWLTIENNIDYSSIISDDNSFLGMI